MGKAISRAEARKAFIGGQTVSLRATINDEIWEFSAPSGIKHESKVRRFNRIVRAFTDFVGEPVFGIVEEGERA